MSAGLIFALASAFVAGAASGLSGFGFALVLAPALLLIYAPADVVAANLLMGLVVNLVVVWEARQSILWRTVVSLFPFALAGLLVGVVVLGGLNADYLRLGVGAAVVISAALLLKEVRIPGAHGRTANAVAGFLSGGLTTSAGMGGPPVVLLFASRGLPKHAFRGTSAGYFLVTGLVSLGALFAGDLVGAGAVGLSITLLPAALVGKVVGTAVVRRISEEAFHLVTLVVIGATGLLGAATATLALL